MSRKRANRFFSRLFPARPYEPVQINGSVHNLARIGGISILCLPPEFAPCDLVVPTRFAATGQFLVDTGDSIPGIFRIPGQTRTIHALKEHFSGHLACEDLTGRERVGDVEVTVRLATLPSRSLLPYNIHDVASTFKHFLGELEGGILGSVEVFESLRKALLPGAQKERGSFEFSCRGIEEEAEEDMEINGTWVARVLCSIECAQRRNLILAVFGILALLRQDPIDSVMGSPKKPAFPMNLTDALQELQLDLPPSNTGGTNDRMSSKALSLVFAPLLLGNLSEQIRIESTHRHAISSPAIFRRRSIAKSASTLHLKRSSGTSTHVSPSKSARIPLRSRGSASPSKYPHISSPMPMCTPQPPPRAELSFADKLRRAGKRDLHQVKELNEGVERNKVAARIIEICVRNWEDVVDCLREGGLKGWMVGPRGF